MTTTQAGPATDESTAAGMLRAMRPKQWLKNVLVLAAPGAAGVILHADVWWRVALTLLAFCATASALYLRNDIADLQAEIDLLQRMRERFTLLSVKRAWENPEQRKEMIAAVGDLQDSLRQIAEGET